MSDFSDMFAELPSFLTSASKSVLDIAQGVANVKFGWQQQDLNAKLQTAQINSVENKIQLDNFLGQAQVGIAQANAQWQLKAAQLGLGGLGSFSAGNINQALANVNARLTGSSGGSSIMTWLTIAGVAFAALQYFKSK